MSQAPSQLWAGDLAASDWEAQHGQEFLRAGDDNGRDLTGVDGTAPTLYATVPPGELLGVDRRFWLPNLGITPPEEVELRYRVHVPAGMDWGGGGKMPGLAGKPVAGGVTDLAWGGVRPDDSWTYRLLFQSDGTVGVYLYAISPVDVNYPNGWAFATSTLDEGWNDIRMYVAMNTPGVTDGTLGLWVNGQLGIWMTDVEYRDVGHDDVDASIILCNFGYGGDAADAPASEMTLHFADFELLA